MMAALMIGLTVHATTPPRVSVCPRSKVIVPCVIPPPSGVCAAPLGWMADSPPVDPVPGRKLARL